MEMAQQQKLHSHQVKSGSKHVQEGLKVFFPQDLTTGS